MTQLALLDYAPPPRPPTIAERFAEFHAAHPEVYQELVELARARVRSGRRRVGIKALWEVARWNLELRCDDGEFKLNNSFTASYARLIMSQEADLADIFETRERRAQ